MIAPGAAHPFSQGQLQGLSFTQLAIGYLSSPLMTPRMFATLVLDGARLYAPTPAGTPAPRHPGTPGTLYPAHVGDLGEALAPAVSFALEFPQT